MTGLRPAREAMELRRRISACVPGAVVAAWGSTGREEMTRLSDLDLLCWNPDGGPLPELRVRHAAYLDLVECRSSAAGLHAWATANATDLHAVLFARHAGPPGERAEQLMAASRRLWGDERLRARETYHLLITSVRVGTISGSSLPRPEKFTLGATRCWTVLAECGQLLAGRALEGGTRDVLRHMAQAGLTDDDAEPAFTLAMRLRRRYENDHACPAGLSGDLAWQYRTSVAAFLGAADDWLNEHAPLRPQTAGLLHEAVHADGVPATAPGVAALPPSGDCPQPGEADAMLTIALTPDAAVIHERVVQSSSESGWWLRHAALLNPVTYPATLEFIARAAVRDERLWPDRNLILYAIRHPGAGQGLLIDLWALRRRLRPMDRDALRRRLGIENEEQGEYR